VKKLIRRILREQADEVQGKEGNESLKYYPLKRLSIALNAMKDIPNLNIYLDDINELKKEPGNSHTIRKRLGEILKLLGFSKGHNMGYGDMVNFEAAYWFTKAFLSNGGYERNFGVGEIELPEITIYEMESEYIEEVHESRTGWGDIVGVGSADEAREYWDGDIDNYITDSEAHDSDWMGVLDVESTDVSEKIIRFNPSWVGFN